MEISIGNFVLSGGEPAAVCLIDAVIRYLPGALGHEQATTEESFSQNMLEYPQYTKPREYRGMEVPEILISGHHAKIEAWRKEQALERTRIRRPDLLDNSDKK
jgi:tRNA (guanine37-N1)-methyltransferase